MAKYRLLLGIFIGLAAVCGQALATALPCDLNVPSQYATVAAAVTAATNGQVICVAAGEYDSAFFDLATKGLTLQGAQAGVDARTRPAKSWAVGDALPSSTETVFTYNGGGFFRITGGLGATLDGVFMPNIGSRALDDQTPGSPSDVTKLTIKNCILKSTDTYTANQNGIVQFAAGPSVSSNNVTLEQNYIETFTRTFLYAPSTNCNNWVVKDNEIRSYYFSFGPFAGNNDGYPGGLVIQGNTFNGDVPGDPPSRVNSPAGYDGLAFNAVLGDAAITENTFTKMIRGLGSVWAYGATIQGNTFTDNYLNAMALYSSDPSTPPKPPSNNVVIENNLIEYNGTPFTTEGDNPSYLSQGIWISRPAGGTTPVDASTIDINYNRFTDLGVSNSTQIWAIRQSGDGTADATNNYWGTSTNDIRVNGSVTTSPYIVSYQDDPAKAGLPGFWPINIVEPTDSPTRAPTAQGFTFSPTQSPTAAPVVEPTPAGTDVVVSFNESASGQGGLIEFSEVDAPGVTTVVQVNTDPANPFYVPPSNFALGDPPTYYDISTTASINGIITVCLVYPEGAFPPGTAPRLFHFVGSDWVDVTTQVDMAARVICGTVTSLSPFALGYLVLNQGPLVLKRLTLSNPRTKHVATQGKDAWSLQAKLDASTAAATFLPDVDTNGIEFELFGRLGPVDKIAFAPGDCRLQHRQTQVACRVKNQTDALKASFKRKGSAKTNKTIFSVKASFARRRFNITTTPLGALAPLEVRMTTTPAVLGIVAANATKCRSSFGTKVRCAH